MKVLKHQVKDHRCQILKAQGTHASNLRFAALVKTKTFHKHLKKLGSSVLPSASRPLRKLLSIFHTEFNGHGFRTGDGIDIDIRDKTKRQKGSCPLLRQ